MARKRRRKKKSNLLWYLIIGVVLALIVGLGVLKMRLTPEAMDYITGCPPGEITNQTNLDIQKKIDSIL